MAEPRSGRSGPGKSSAADAAGGDLFSGSPSEQSSTTERESDQKQALAVELKETRSQVRYHVCRSASP